MKLKKSTILMFVFWLTVITVTIFSSAFQAQISQFTSQLLLIIFTYAATYAWFIEDARESGIMPSKALMIGVTTAASICIPYYLLRYKGYKRAIISAGKFTGLFVASSCLVGALSI